MILPSMNFQKLAKNQFFKNVLITRADFFLLIALFFSISTYSQKANYRRHFLIAYDVSSPFVSAEKANPSYRKSLLELFRNSNVTGYEEANQSNLISEEGGKPVFFDPLQDEISFFHFNLANNEFSALRLADNSTEQKAASSFNNLFLKDKKIYWSELKNKENIEQYITSLFQTERTPGNFQYHVSMSNFVFPLVLHKIDRSKYAREYILIILSDFLSGSMQGNKQDYNRIKEVYGYSAVGNVPANSAPDLIKNFSDKLASRFYKVDFFDFTFSGSPKPAIIAYKIKPQAGDISPEDISIFLDSDIELKQLGYRSKNFRISGTKIRFTHNQNLKPVEVSLQISITGSDKEYFLFDKIIASLNTEGRWTSKYTGNSKLMDFDSAHHQYSIPRMKVRFDTLIRKSDFENLQVKYIFKTEFSPPGDAQSVNYIYTAERQLQKSDLYLASKTKTLLMLYGIPVIILMCAVLYLLAYGKPQKLFLHINGYLDSYQVIDYKKVGKLLTPYKFWDVNQDMLPVHGLIHYKRPGFFLNWNSQIKLTITNVSLPEGFDICLKESTGAIKEYGPEYNLFLKKGKANDFQFFICIRQNDITVKLENPVLVKFSISATMQDKVLFFKSDIHKTLEYIFHLGPDLGDVWVGLDPGTTGSCITVGSHGVNILLAKDNASAKSVLSSKLVFDKRADFKVAGDGIPDSIYRTGEPAEPVFDLKKQYEGFQSIKKLLGFKNHKEIHFDNGSSLSLTGKDLSGLLIKGMYKVLYQSVKPELPAHKEYLDKNNLFNPLRAVVAIPNNFTISKIQDIIECVGHLKQFKEIRYVYEAEAVLFYYLSNYRKFNSEGSALDKETILVFDMGGATINTTVVDASLQELNNRPVYNIDFLSKIGYGIGGDTIDYCIAKFLLQFSDEILELKAFDLHRNVQQLKKLALEIKFDIVRNYKGEFDFLITADRLQYLLNSHLGTNIMVDKESNFYSFFKKNSKNKFPFFASSVFKEYVYNNIEDAVKEVIELADHPINKVIFSGRSTFYPGIKEIVIDQFNKRKKYPKFINLQFEESKTSVAQGACWYGINKNAVRLNNLKTNAAFGIKRTRSADKTDAEFIELVEMGAVFDIYSDEVGSFTGQAKVHDDFAFDGAKVNFYQVMGKDADKILSMNQKHKFSKVAGIQLPLTAAEIAIKVNEDDNIECAVKLVSDQVRKEKGVVSDQEMEDANEEHYTWTV